MVALSTSTSSSTAEKAALIGNTTTTPPPQKFLIRRARLSDLAILAAHAKDAYWLSPIDNFLFPGAAEHPEDLVRIKLQGIQRRFAEANNLSLVAYVPAHGNEKEKVVGYGQFSRKGSSEGAKGFVKSKGRIHLVGLWVLRWWFWAWHLMLNNNWPDRISDIRAVQALGKWNQMDERMYWTAHPEREERWHAGSVVVSPEHQGEGVGRLLMGHVINKAQKERVLMGLTASPHGEILYQKLGFQMLGDFGHRVANDEGGGIMIWYPEGWEGKRHDL